MTPAARRPDTPLRRQLNGEPDTRSTALDAFRTARRTFLAGERVDMRGLARALDVDRATLYRWVGSRDQLLTEVLWSLLARTFASLQGAHCHDPDAGRGTSSAASVVVAGVVRAVMANAGMARFLDREGDLALRLLTTRATDFEARLIALVTRLVQDEVAAGRLDPTVPVDDLAYVLVRIMESYIYIGLITGEHPDPDRAARVIDTLLPAAGTSGTASPD